jgi:hypothetical protein
MVHFESGLSKGVDMIRLALSVSFLFLLSTQIRAESVGTGEGSQKQPAAKAAAQQADTGEYGEGLDEVATNGSVGSVISHTTRGVSWRNTQLILMGMHKIRCRKGGISAKVAAIPALTEEGFCNQKNSGKKFDQYPKGTVWVYHNGRHGNTAVKIQNGKYYDNRLMSAPPPSRGFLAAIMVPGCGKKTVETRCAGLSEESLKDLEEKNSESKAAAAEAMEGHEGVSQKRLQAEASCKYESAPDDPQKFTECVDKQLGK